MIVLGVVDEDIGETRTHWSTQPLNVSNAITVGRYGQRRRN
jgi:hypothetical protein